MVGKLAPNSTQFTRGLVKYILGRDCFRAVFQNGEEFATSPTPPIVEQLKRTHKRCTGTWSVRTLERNNFSAEQTGLTDAREIKIISQERGVLNGTPDDRADESFRLFGWRSNARGSFASVQ